MKASILRAPGPVEENPLEFAEVADPEPGKGEIRVRVKVCGVCRTDLHMVEGELPPRKSPPPGSPLIPGHQIVGIVDKAGEGAARFQLGARVGIPWLHGTDQSCEYCLAGKENLCDNPTFTGYSVNGGYAEYAIARQDFAFPIPDSFSDDQAAPLLCAGIIGFRSLRLTGLTKGGRLAFYGFGAAAHVAIQVARHWGIEVYACTRGVTHQQLALQLGAAWAGEATSEPPEKLDAAIIFAPAGELVPPALKALKKGGVLVLGGIHMSPIPSFSYDLLYQERSIRSVTNNTRQDGDDFLSLAAKIPIRSRITTFPLREANRALNELKHDGIDGAAVIDCTS